MNNKVLDIYSDNLTDAETESLFSTPKKSRKGDRRKIDYKKAKRKAKIDLARSFDGLPMYDNLHQYSKNKRKAFYKSYNAKIAELDKKYKGKMSNILDFLYESDCDGIMDVPHCRSIYKVIKDYDDDILYGYAGRKDCAKFADFKAIVKEGIDSGDGFTWS